MQEEIISKKGLGFIAYLREVYRFRQLLWILALKDIKVRFAQMLLGIAWAFLGPAFMLMVFTLVFHEGANFTGKLPYPLFAATGIAVYNYFSYLVSNGGNSIMDNQGLIHKVYFPRLIIPLSKAIVGLVDLGAVLILSAGLLLYYQPELSLNVAFLPLVLLLTILSGLTAAIWVSALTVRYRDLKEFIPFALGAGFFLTPVVYPVTLIPERFAALNFLNPLTGIVEGFRWCLSGERFPHSYSWLALGLVIVFFLLGILYFKSVERNLPDQL